MYRTLWRIRIFEGQVQRLAAAEKVPGFPHLSTGQEAVAVGVCAHLTRKDALFTSHRGHGHTLAKGSDVQATLQKSSVGTADCAAAAAARCILSMPPMACFGATGVVAEICRSPLAQRGLSEQSRDRDQRRLLRRRRHGSGRIPRDLKPRGAVETSPFVRLREQRLCGVHEPRGTLERKARECLRRPLRYAGKYDRRQRFAGSTCRGR